MDKVVRQNDKLFMDLLNKVPVLNINDDVEKLLKERFIHPMTTIQRCFRHVRRECTCCEIK